MHTQYSSVRFEIINMSFGAFYSDELFSNLIAFRASVTQFPFMIILSSKII